MEIPVTHMIELSRLTDFDFAIAHRIVEDEKYRNAFTDQREAGRMIFLDNGFHERGNGADPKILLQAQFLIAADVVISPDRIDDPDFTKEYITWSLDHFGSRTAGVIVGEHLSERMDILDTYLELHIPYICFPYRRARQVWIEEFDKHRPGWETYVKVHFLGMQTLEEAVMCATRFPDGTFDTSKPIKWAYQGKRLDEIEMFHGAWPAYDTFLSAEEMNADQSMVMLYNLALLRKALV
jgi:hypothetical protein